MKLDYLVGKTVTVKHTQGDDEDFTLLIDGDEYVVSGQGDCCAGIENIQIHHDLKTNEITVAKVSGDYTEVELTDNKGNVFTIDGDYYDGSGWGGYYVWLELVRI